MYVQTYILMYMKGFVDTCDTLDGKWSCGQVQCVHHEIHTGVLLYSVWASMRYYGLCKHSEGCTYVYTPGAFKRSANFCATITFSRYKIESMCSVAMVM